MRLKVDQDCALSEGEAIEVGGGEDWLAVVVLSVLCCICGGQPESRCLMPDRPLRHSPTAEKKGQRGAAAGRGRRVDLLSSVIQYYECLYRKSDFDLRTEAGILSITTTFQESKITKSNSRQPPCPSAFNPSCAADALQESVAPLRVQTGPKVTFFRSRSNGDFPPAILLSCSL